MGSWRAIPVWTLAAGSLFWPWSAASNSSALSGEMRVGFAVAVVAWTILGRLACRLPRSRSRSCPDAANLMPHRRSRPHQHLHRQSELGGQGAGEFCVPVLEAVLGEAGGPDLRAGQEFHAGFAHA